MIPKLIEQMAQKAPTATLFRTLLQRILDDDSLNDNFNNYR
jgi:hypothetical protein